MSSSSAVSLTSPAGTSMSKAPLWSEVASPMPAACSDRLAADARAEADVGAGHRGAAVVDHLAAQPGEATDQDVVAGDRLPGAQIEAAASGAEDAVPDRHHLVVAGCQREGVRPVRPA